ncbi:MAG: hypothetical protein A2Y89_02675 [Chloroflexi bacterium RBG_13_51_18]|nr:MAG: hypothetical protein A2Y89_02675 [Chloroflexi bacterium RBG_13_51_18]
MSETEDYTIAAPWDDITGKPTEWAPEAHAADHEAGGADEMDCAGLAGRVNYVDRGDPAAADWDQSMLTTDALWRDLDCSAIVPAGAKAIILLVILYDDIVGGNIAFRKNGNTATHNAPRVYQSVSNLFFSGRVIVPCDANRTIEYWATTKTWTLITITVSGWFI